MLLGSSLLPLLGWLPQTPPRAFYRSTINQLSDRSAAVVCTQINRRTVAGAIALGQFHPSFISSVSAAEAPRPTPRPTNEVVRTVNGIRHKRLGGSDIIVSEVGLGTQRWGSADFNGPDEQLCHQMLDRAVLQGGVNLIDTAEQYPIPSDRARPEGTTEQIIGSWLAKDRSRRQKVVLASKITGGRNVNAKSIRADLEGSLRRLGTDYLDVYLLHWPARYTPQANWGQSLEYHREYDEYARAPASFEEIAGAMGELIREWAPWDPNPNGTTRDPEGAPPSHARARRCSFRCALLHLTPHPPFQQG